MFSDGTQKRRIQMQRTYKGILPGYFSPTRGAGNMWNRFMQWQNFQDARGLSIGGLDRRDPQIQAWVNAGRYDISPDGMDLKDLWQPPSTSVAPVYVPPATPPVVVRPPLPPVGGGGGNDNGGSGGTRPDGTPAPDYTIMPVKPTPKPTTQVTPTPTPPQVVTPPAPVGVPITTNKPGWKPGDWLY